MARNISKIIFYYKHHKKGFTRKEIKAELDALLDASAIAFTTIYNKGQLN